MLFDHLTQGPEALPNILMIAVHLAHLAWVNESQPKQSTFGRRHGDLKNSCTSGYVVIRQNDIAEPD